MTWLHNRLSNIWMSHEVVMSHTRMSPFTRMDESCNANQSHAMSMTSLVYLESHRVCPWIESAHAHDGCVALMDASGLFHISHDSSICHAHTYGWVMWSRITWTHPCWACVSHIWMSHVNYRSLLQKNPIKETIFCKSPTWMRRMTHMDESCEIWKSPATRMDESCHTYEWVMWHIRIESRNANGWVVSHVNESCDTYERVPPRIWMSCVTHTTGMPWAWRHSHVHDNFAGSLFRKKRII